MPQRNEFSLKALADTLVVDLEAGDRRVATTIEYTKDPEWVILHRIHGDDWIKVPLEIVGLDDPNFSRGSFQTIQLKPGQLYEACIVRDVIATTDVFARLSISRSPWLDTGDGLLVLPLTEHVVARGPQQTFGFVVKDLLPGTQYFELLLLTDEFGNWQFVTDDFTTKRRKVEVMVTKLYIVYDSDENSSGEATFRSYVHSGNELLCRSNAVVFGDQVDSGQEYAVPATVGSCVLEPHAVTPDTKRLFFTSLSREDDSGSVPVDDDDFGSATKELRIPVGPGENVDEDTDSLYLSGTDGWNHYVDFKYSIKYQ